MNRALGLHDAPPVLHELLSRPRLGPREIDAFLAGRAVPIVEGSSCTFLYRGEADVVQLRHFIFGLPSTQPFHRLPRTDLWYATLEIPLNSRIEYKIEVIQHGMSHWLEDPLNPARARDPFGANSVAYGEGYEVPEWTLLDVEARLGTLEDVDWFSRALGRQTHVTVYLPARYRPTRQYPLLVVQDGGDYMQYSGMKTVLDNLIHRLEISEMIVALTHPEDRLREYGNNPAYARYIVDEVLPKLAARYPLQDSRDARGIMGASFGAVASLSTAVLYPTIFGRLLLQSGSFAFTDIGISPRGPVFEPVVQFINEYRRAPAKIADKVFVSCGTYESLIYENRSFVPILQRTGMEVRYVEARDGHNWENWRDRLREGLSWLFPGPLWFVYE